MKRLSGKTALITGASSGIGETIARQLAALSCPLVLVARRTERLEALKSELQQQYGIDVITISIDLSVAGSAQALYDQCQAQGIRVDILINNAGFAKHGYMLDIPLTVHQEMMQLMVTTLTELTYLFGRDMRQRKEGYVLLVSSLLGFLPGPQFATYSAIKAYALNLADSLVREFKRDNVRITALCPGGTATEFMDVSGQKIDGMRSLAMMSSDSVARSGLISLAKGQGHVVPGLLYKLAVLGLRLVPRNLQAVFGEMATK